MTSTSSALPRPAAVAVSVPWQRALRQVSAVTAVGLGLGFLVGGIGSRLAMRALFLTSDPAVRGMISDDGFVIGRFSAFATLNLLVVGTVIGVIGAFAYAAVRPFLLGPRWLRYTGCALGAGAVVGSMLVHTSGVDFTALGPRWFAIALFVALPAGFGALIAPAVDRVLRDDSWFHRASLRRALLPLVVLLFPPLLVFVGVPATVVAITAQRVPAGSRVAAVATHPATMWSLRALWLVAGTAGLVSLVADARVLL